ncbi:aspartyl-phosphate phosphatase Spo0E family protein [Bacillus sp. USDA818B3_A]|uniref:aspartyl-phosphate phosphatase Spo0E family protein n=1 Tax=Bacillus sp. USDA818B3_A TaxID=2698834 RepID=UPI0013687A5C|nr:aspartyl-phosphate phosphatase Spo0E family protein [Bacillus sp. USDA818B3_A]
MEKTQTKDNMNQLKMNIELLRNEMIRLGTEEGLTSQRTLQISEELDRYIMKYQLLYSFGR